ncbi:MbnP family protein [Ruegeria lacuscaerulensis]|uniref:MbnP family protein n=1 Tax=Ruegeria lacuscaerulensis TaxID=55218 RepID=UPI00147F7126|nr:MbnP family protein [Ruegeria lacuscaerulensis]
MSRLQAMSGFGLLVLLAIGWIVFVPGPKRTTDVTVTLRATMNGAPLTFDQFMYDNPAGPGAFRVRDFRFYLSNLVLTSGDEEFVEPDSYYLARFDNADRSYVITLSDVPLRRIEGLRFLIGVDPDANGSILARGDLDPNSQMAWNWEVGYKFVLFEGALDVDGAISPLVYHVGFSENAREVSVLVPADMTRAGETQINLDVDLAKLFDNAALIDMQALPTVKFDRTDARMLADNYADMISASY